LEIRDGESAKNDGNEDFWIDFCNNEVNFRLNDYFSLTLIYFFRLNDFWIYFYFWTRRVV